MTQDTPDDIPISSPAEVSPSHLPVSLLDLPDELVLRILAELPPKAAELTTASRVCKRLHAVAQEQVLWAHLFNSTPGLRLKPDYARRAVATTVAPGTWDDDGDYIPSTASLKEARDPLALLNPAKLLAYVYDLLWPSNLPKPGEEYAGDDAVPVHYPTLFRARCAIADEMKALGPHHVFTSASGHRFRGTATEGEGGDASGSEMDEDAPMAGSSDTVVAPNHLWMMAEHSAKVYTVRVHGSWVISGSRDKTVKIWHLPPVPCDGAKITHGPSLVASAEGHEGSILALDFELVDATTGKGFMVTGSSDMTAKVWEIDWGQDDGGVSGDVQGVSARVVCELRGAADRVAAVAITDQYVITGSQDNRLRIYEREAVYTNESVSPIRTVDVGPVCGISLNSRGLAQVAVATTEGRWAIIDLDTGQRTLHGGEGEEGYGCIVWKDDYILAGAEGGKTILYSGLYGHRMRTYCGPKKRLVRAIHLDLANNTVLSAGHDGQIHFTDLDSWVSYRSYELGGAPIFGMDADGLNLVFATGDAVGFVLYGNGQPYAGMFA